jgi:hypothetical protein
VEKLDPINYLRPSKWDCEKDGHVPLVCDLKEKAALIETLVGGKGLSLALLQSMQDTRVGCERCARSGGKDSCSYFAVPGTCWVLRDHRSVHQTDANIPPFGVSYHLSE